MAPARGEAPTDKVRGFDISGAIMAVKESAGPQ